MVEEIVGVALNRTKALLEHHRVEVKLPANLPLILVDGLLMEQLLVNLLENASRHTPHGTQVAIEARSDSRMLTLTVTDSGPGIPQGMQEKIFGKFFRATPSPDSVRGSGLGLAICRAIAEIHHGTLTAKNNPLAGAEFVLQLPLEKRTPQMHDMEVETR